MITADYVQRYVTSWETRHDDWVAEYLAPRLNSVKKTMSGIRLELREKILNDWRYALAFFIDRTTYQSRKDIVNIRTATYLFDKIVNLPQEYSVNAINEMISGIRDDKITGKATHIRERADIERLEAVCKYLFSSSEKNFSRIVLNQKFEWQLWQFLDRFPYVSRNKTAPFYMKFMSWLFDLDIKPLTIDRHVLNSLMVNSVPVDSNSTGAENAILSIAKELNLPAVKVETALYEESWLSSNRLTNEEGS